MSETEAHLRPINTVAREHRINQMVARTIAIEADLPRVRYERSFLIDAETEAQLIDIYIKRHAEFDRGPHGKPSNRRRRRRRELTLPSIGSE